MAEKRSARLKKILAADPSFSNVMVGILMLFFESLWLVIYYDGRRGEVGKYLGWDVQLLMAAIIIILTVPFLLANLFLASSSAGLARRIALICSAVIGFAAVVYSGGILVEVGTTIPLSFAASRLPFVLFGAFVLLRINMLRALAVKG